jgi:nucleoid-associated protein YgaU
MRRAFCGPFLLALMAASVVTAGELEHTVRSGESASAIAKRYYGGFDSAEFLLEFNGRSGATIRSGEVLRVPYSELHTIRGGDTWSVLADRHLGRIAAWPAIPELNDRPPEAPLRLGERIRIPVLLRYDLQRGDTLAVLAQRFYGDPERSDLIQEFNAIDDPRRLSVGQTLELPLIAPALHEREGTATAGARSKPPAAAVKPAPAPVEVEEAEATAVAPLPRARFTKELESARQAFSGGDFDAARDRLEGLRSRVTAEGNVEDQVSLWRLLGFVYVAFDLDEQACESFRELGNLDTELGLDPDLVSPKIRERLGACVG